jgi:hypothetical protein
VNIVMNLDSVKGDNFLKIILCLFCPSVRFIFALKNAKVAKIAFRNSATNCSMLVNSRRAVRNGSV